MSTPAVQLNANASPGSPMPCVWRLGAAYAISPDAERASKVQARGRPCRLAGRSLSASCLQLARRKPRFAILAALGFLRRSIGMGDPSQSNEKGDLPIAD